MIIHFLSEVRVVDQEPQRNMDICGFDRRSETVQILEGHGARRHCGLVSLRSHGDEPVVLDVIPWSLALTAWCLKERKEACWHGVQQLTTYHSGVATEVNGKIKYIPKTTKMLW